MNLSPSDQADAACCWRPTNGGTSPAQHRDGNVVRKGRNKGGQTGRGMAMMTTGMKAHRITENRPIGSNPTISTQKKLLGSRIHTGVGAARNQGRQVPPGHGHSAHPHCPSPHRFSYAADPQQIEKRVQGHAGPASPSPSPPREGHVTYCTLSPCSGNHSIISTRSEQCCSPAFLAPRDSLRCGWGL